jgi:hypothetical protein
MRKDKMKNWSLYACKHVYTYRIYRENMLSYPSPTTYFPFFYPDNMYQMLFQSIYLILYDNTPNLSTLYMTWSPVWVVHTTLYLYVRNVPFYEMSPWLAAMRWDTWSQWCRRHSWSPIMVVLTEPWCQERTHHWPHPNNDGTMQSTCLTHS